MAPENNQPPASVPGPTAPLAVASPGVASAPQVVSAPVNAKSSVPMFGGNIGKKPRADGLKPGSPEAIAADKARDAARKRGERAAKAAAAEPAALPAAPVATGSDAGPPPAGNAGYVADAGVAVAALLAWEADKIRPLTDQLIGLAEDADVAAFAKVAREGDLPDKVVRKIEVDAHWPKAGKLMLERSTAKLSAKYLNMTGVSAAYQDELEFAGGIGLIVTARRGLMRELRALVAEFKAESSKEEKK